MLTCPSLPCLCLWLTGAQPPLSLASLHLRLDVDLEWFFVGLIVGHGLARLFEFGTGAADFADQHVLYLFSFGRVIVFRFLFAFRGFEFLFERRLDFAGRNASSPSLRLSRPPARMRIRQSICRSAAPDRSRLSLGIFPTRAFPTAGSSRFRLQRSRRSSICSPPIRTL